MGTASWLYEHGVAGTYNQLGLLAESCKDFVGAARWLTKCLIVFHGVNDEHSTQIGIHNFARVFRAAPAETRGEMRQIWTDAGLQWPDEFDKPSDDNE